MSMESFKLKHFYTDFVVNEVFYQPAYCEKQQADYTIIWLEKVGHTTFEAIDIMAKWFNLGVGHVAAQGLKDEDGITKQIISLKKIIGADDVLMFNTEFRSKIHHSASFDQATNSLNIVNILGYSQAPVEKRRLYGNSFLLVIRNLKKRTAENIYSLLAENRFFSFINYYDSQRFGKAGRSCNTHQIGNALIEQDYQAAYLKYKAANDISVEKPLTSITEYKDFFSSLNPNELSFFVSSYNSYLWNHAAADHIRNNSDCIDVPMKEMDPLPIPGNCHYSCMSQLTITGFKIDTTDFSVSPAKKSRPLLNTIAIFSAKPTDDEVFRNRAKIKIDFLLPTGSYATMVIKQLVSRTTYS